VKTRSIAVTKIAVHTVYKVLYNYRTKPPEKPHLD